MAAVEVHLEILVVHAHDVHVVSLRRVDCLSLVRLAS